MLNKIRAYLSDPTHKKVLPAFAVIAIVLALPIIIFLAQTQQTLRQRAAELNSPTTQSPYTNQEPVFKDVHEVGQLTNQLLQLNKNPRSETGPYQTTTKQQLLILLR